MYLLKVVKYHNHDYSYSSPFNKSVFKDLVTSHDIGESRNIKGIQATEEDLETVANVPSLSIELS